MATLNLLLTCIVGILLVGVSIAVAEDNLFVAWCFLSRIFLKRFHGTFVDVTFYEPFDTNWKGRWIVTKNGEYKGKWKYEKSQGHDDFGLLVSEKAKKYAISYNLPKIVDPNKGSLTFQYDVRFQKGIECGGAYLKFILPEDEKFDNNEINNETPYSIMFGADKCGATNKVHFIFRHKNPVNGEYVEHHMKNPALVEVDRFTHVYTTTMYPNNTVRVFVDGEIAKICDFMTNDFEPMLIPPMMIPDPTDEKPSTWDERKKIPDPHASKPLDWDEGEPSQIVDMDAIKPEGWLEDELEEVDDPTSTKPSDWNDKNDGEWEQEKMDNPNCKNAPGCGLWKPPKKNNPAFKGKWSAPLIDNPNYSGIWEARQIPNPNHFDATRPQFEKIGKIGIEIWTMDDGIIFDNILITKNESFAQDIRTQTWSKKINFEKKIDIDEDEEEKRSLKNMLRGPRSIKDKMFRRLYRIINWFTIHIPFLERHKYQLIIATKTIEENQIFTIGFFGTIPILLISILSLTYARKDLIKKRSLHEGKQLDDNMIHAVSSDTHQKPTKDEDDEVDSFHEIEKEEKHETKFLQASQGEIEK